MEIDNKEKKQSCFMAVGIVSLITISLFSVFLVTCKKTEEPKSTESKSNTTGVFNEDDPFNVCLDKKGDDMGPICTKKDIPHGTTGDNPTGEKKTEK